MDNRKKLALIPAYMPDEALIEITKELHITVTLRL